MLKRIIYTSLIILAGFGAAVFAQEKTIVGDANAKKMLLGKNLLSLQWIGWDYSGTANVTSKAGVLRLKGEQKQRGGSDFVKIDGTIKSIETNEFKNTGDCGK
jgi:hypothetical protein